MVPAIWTITIMKNRFHQNEKLIATNDRENIIQIGGKGAEFHTQMYVPVEVWMYKAWLILEIT